MCVYGDVCVCHIVEIMCGVCIDVVYTCLLASTNCFH